MADNGLWIKLWTDAGTDEKTAPLTNEEWGFLTRLWMYIKKEGDSGTITIHERAVPVFGWCHVSGYDEFLKMLDQISIFFTNINVSSAFHVTISERYITVSFPKWLKRQGDWSTGRVRKFRQKGAERNADETVASTSPSSSTSPSTSNKEKKALFSKSYISEVEKMIVTDSHRALASEVSEKHNVDIDPEEELCGFRDYIIQEHRVYKDLNAAFRNRIRNAVKYGNGRKKQLTKGERGVLNIQSWMKDKQQEVDDEKGRLP